MASATTSHSPRVKESIHAERPSGLVCARSRQACAMFFGNQIRRVVARTGIARSALAPKKSRVAQRRILIARRKSGSSVPDEG